MGPGNEQDEVNAQSVTSRNIALSRSAPPEQWSSSLQKFDGAADLHKTTSGQQQRSKPLDTMITVATAYDALRSHLQRKPTTPSARWRPYHSRKVASTTPDERPSEREVALPTPEYSVPTKDQPVRRPTRQPAVQDPEGLIEDSLNLLASIYNPSMAARATATYSRNTPSALPTPPASPTPKTSVPSIAPHVMHWFIVELLRRSHTSAPVIRAALEYISRAAPEIQRVIEESDERSCARDSPLLDPRRVYLAAIILGSKFLLDRTYTNKTWASVSGLDALEVGRCERTLAEALQWRLWVGGPGSASN
ncbi:Cyclin protein [Ceratobasidium theobromae]|uniref:Cyclin protein n=1 Tax=Ceratobasidium theobromae TaxID=1582974 RepID=A0A5N5QBL2_9AGAM|nr:Cyclin protein [Ceratobasidium theobromae]